MPKFSWLKINSNFSICVLHTRTNLGEIPKNKTKPARRPRCSVNIQMRTCGAVYELVGSCEQKFHFSGQCELRVTQTSRVSYEVFDAAKNKTFSLEMSTKHTT